MKTKFFQTSLLVLVLISASVSGQTKKPECDHDVYADRYNSDAKRNMTLDSACNEINKKHFSSAYRLLCKVAEMDSLATGEPDALVDQQRRKIKNYLDNNGDDAAATASEPETKTQEKTVSATTPDPEIKNDKEDKKAKEQEKKAAKEKEDQEKKAAKEKEEQERKSAKEKEEQDKKAGKDKEDQEKQALKEKEAQEKQAAKDREAQEKQAAKEKAEQDKKEKASKNKKDKKSAKDEENKTAENQEKTTSGGEENNGNSTQGTTPEPEKTVSHENETPPVA